LPPNAAFTCSYVARQIDVKATYGLSVTAAEHQAMATVLTGCGQTAPAATAPAATAPAATAPAVTAPAVTAPAVTAPAATAPAAPAVTVPTPATTAPATKGAVTTAPAGVYYSNCDAVRAAGKAPLHTGDPGYRSGLDRDGDGIACE
jgi:hypothetical protein